MTIEAPHDEPRFPRSYALACCTPLALLACAFMLPALLGHGRGMAPALLCSLLIGPSGLVVAAWGATRLFRGHAAQFPALRWLVPLSAWLGLVGFVLS
jgi:hypothetical protein